MFDFKKKGTSGRIEEDTTIRELDEFGRPRQTAEEKRAEAGHTNRSAGGNGTATWRNRGIAGGVLVILLLGFIHFTGNTQNVIDMFSSTPEENMNAMFNGIRDTEKVNKLEGNLHPIYDVKSLYASEDVFKQAEKEYVVYFYTEDEVLDAPFNEWVAANEQNIPIYRINIWDNTDLALDEITAMEPTFILVYEQERGHKVIDSAIKVQKEFENIPVILEALKAHRISK